MKQIPEENLSENVEELIIDQIQEAFYDLFVPYENYYKLLDEFHQSEASLLPPSPAMKKLASLLKKGKRGPTESEVNKLCLYFFTNKELLNTFYNSYLPENKKLLNRLIWEDFVRYEEVRQSFKTELIDVGTLDGSEIKLLPEFESWRFCFLSNTTDTDYDYDDDDDDEFYYDDEDYWDDPDFGEEDDYWQSDEEYDLPDQPTDKSDAEDLQWNHAPHAGPATNTERTFLDGHLHQIQTERKILDKKMAFQLPMFMRYALATVAERPDNYRLHPISLPEGCYVYQGEAALFQELPAIMLELNGKSLKFRRNNRLNTASLEKAQRKLGLHTFPGDIGYLKTAMLASHLAPYKFYSPSNDALGLLHLIFNQASKTAMTEAALYPFDGIQQLSDYEINEFEIDDILKILSVLPPEKWISVDNILDYVNYHYMNMTPIFPERIRDLDMKENFLYTDAFTNANRLEKLKIIKTYFIKGVLLTAACFGLIDLAYPSRETNPNVKEKTTRDSGFCACRITPLGRHFFQDFDDYTIPAAARPVRFEPDHHRLVIKVSGRIELAETMLRQWAKRLPGHPSHLQLDTTSLLNNCSTKKDLIAAIAQFCETLSLLPGDLPDFWKIQLMQLIDRAGTVESVQMARVYQISPHDRALHQLLARDPVLSKIVLKAEQFHIIVSASQQTAFTKRLVQCGYLPTSGHEREPGTIRFAEQNKEKQALLERFDNIGESEIEQQTIPAHLIPKLRNALEARKKH